MNIAQRVNKQVNRWPDLKVFSLQDFEEYQDNPKAVSEALSRQVKQDNIIRFSKGRFYKPKATRFGKVRPGQNSFVEAYLYKWNKNRKEQVAYMTGASLLYDWGLTTQIPSCVQLASTEGSFNQTIKGIRINAKRANAEKLNENRILALQVLDVVKALKNIPDADDTNIIRVLRNRVSKFTKSSIRDAERIAVRYYRPSVRAFIGALMEETLGYQSRVLKKSLSPLSQYKSGVNPNLLSTSESWQLQ